MPDISVPGVTVSGPLFDGTSLRIVAKMIDDVDHTLADAGVNLVQYQLEQNLQNPTGFYESNIVTERHRPDYLVTDSGVIYGPWLEGTGSRNQTTKFKGYSSFRKAAQQLNQAADLITQRVVDKYVKQLNG